jgi:hypothetical protein
MPKIDFSFTYYDGDAARDKAHMDRLQRGGYDDIISAQRKRGHLTADDLRRVLGKDYDYCMESLIGWVLKQDDDGLYYIEWVDKSIAKDSAYSKKQSDRAGSRWKKETPQIPMDFNHAVEATEFQARDVVPLYDGTGTTYNQLMDIDLLKEKTYLDKLNFVRIYTGWGIKEPTVYEWLSAFNKFLNYQGVSTKTEKDYRNHFGNWLNKQDYHSVLPADYIPITQNNGSKDFKRGSTGTKPDAKIIPTGNRGQL